MSEFCWFIYPLIFSQEKSNEEQLPLTLPSIRFHSKTLGAWLRLEPTQQEQNRTIFHSSNLCQITSSPVPETSVDYEDLKTLLLYVVRFQAHGLQCATFKQCAMFIQGLYLNCTLMHHSIKFWFSSVSLTQFSPTVYGQSSSQNHVNGVEPAEVFFIIYLFNFLVLSSQFTMSWYNFSRR